MRKYSFDIQVNPKGTKQEIIISRKGRALAYWDSELKRAYCTPEAYRKNSPDVTLQAVKFAEKVGQQS